MRLIIVCALLLPAIAGFARIPDRYDLVIHEIMPKPLPAKGLPPYEYVELKNRSSQPVQLKNWRLGINRREVVLPAYLLQPDSLVLLCTPAAVPAFHVADALGIDRFPALADDSCVLVLYDPAHRVIHAIDYNLGWYNGTAAAKGGVSLEMVDPAFPCSGRRNWMACTDAAGGTPGKVNAVAGRMTDPAKPDLVFAGITDSIHLLLQFGKPVDSVQAADPQHYQFTGGLRAVAAQPVMPLLAAVLITLNSPIQDGEIYTVHTTGITDCNDQESLLYNTITFMIPHPPEPDDIVINEVLFYPPAGIPEFIEIYNGGSRAIDLQQLRLGTWKADNATEGWKSITASSRLLMPGGFLALTTDVYRLSNYYHHLAASSAQQVGSLPPMPHANGNIALLRADSLVIDRLYYNEKMHFPLASDVRGISLERLQYNRPSSDPSNWHSAAATSGYATPGLPNSQYYPQSDDTLHVSLSPAVFSPDQDGIDKVTLLSWQLPGPGYVGNITIYEATGRVVRYLARNMLMGNKGTLQWDGLGENAVILPSGIYIFLIDLFNLKGEVKHIKRTVVMARKLSRG
ncbi:lamin tail domain-containing protein [Chitinophaga sp. 212800010-3]|uniref:lamin tail domain-containing protein n=1 Tax=unclassified Chitinophaga TaxID=2619133 RepID=UPI002DE80EE0|nr:LTD domain-containing protein [Chitinophaga sp. 212800010-3]